jgi:hypothetical protein
VARKIRHPRLGANSNRVILPVRREPYWADMAAGCHVGDRRLSTGRSWIAKWRDAETGQRRYEALRVADDHLEAVGSRKSIEIAMDWTDFDADNQTTTMLSLLTSHGRATPLIWLTVDKDTLKDNRNRDE